MIALVTSAVAFSDNFFLGGGQKFIKNIVPKVAKKESMIFLPVIREINFADNLSEFKEKLEKNNLIIPEKILKYSRSSINYEKEMLKIYKDEIIKNNIRIVFDPLPAINITYSNKLDKLKMVKYALSPFISACNNVVSFDAYCLSKITGKKLVVIQQQNIRELKAALNYYINGYKLGFKEPLGLLKLRFQYINAIKLHKILKTAKILSVSEGTLKEIQIDKKKYDAKVLEYALPIEEDLIKYRTKAKENYMIFFSRFDERKGVTELPLIMKYVTSQIRDIKLYMIGKFYDKKYEEYIMNLIKKINLENNIIFLGLRKDEDLYKIVSKAKLLIYPTHNDSYSYVILESLAVRTPVVSYALPGPYSVFKDLPGVRFVKEFDIKGIANEAVRILKMKDEDYFNLVYNEKVDMFIEKRRGWDKVAEEIYSHLKLLD